MPPKPKNTKEEIIAAAVQVIREKGVNALTARSLGKQLNASATSIFTHFKSMDEVMECTMASARELYGTYVDRGLSMNPPFKGFGMEFIRFSEEESNIFELLFKRCEQSMSFNEFIGTDGHEEFIVKAIMDTFELDHVNAKQLYHNLWAYCFGIASLVSAGVCKFTQEELSIMLGTACRGFIMALKAPTDERIGIIPSFENKMQGTVGSYIKTE